MGWFVGDGGIIMRTTDGGDIWHEQYRGDAWDRCSWTDEQIDSISMLPSGHGCVAAARGLCPGGATPVQTFLTTNDFGNTWTPAVFAWQPSARHYLTDVQMVTDSQGWAVGNAGAILYTNDGGVSWVEKPSPTNRDLKALHFVAPDHGWAVGDGGKILTYQQEPPS